MYQLLCHVNVPVPADTWLTRTADTGQGNFRLCPCYEADSGIHYKILHDNFNEFGTIPVRNRYRYQVVHFIYNFQPGSDGKRTRKRRPFLRQRTLGELGRVRNRWRFILRITLFYSCTLYYIAELYYYIKIIIMFACIRDYHQQNVLG